MLKGFMADSVFVKLAYSYLTGGTGRRKICLRLKKIYRTVIILL